MKSVLVIAETKEKAMQIITPNIREELITRKTSNPARIETKDGTTYRMFGIDAFKGPALGTCGVHVDEMLIDRYLPTYLFWENKDEILCLRFCNKEPIDLKFI